MRALAALLALLPFVLAARVFNDPYDLRALARQAAENDVPRVPPMFNINSGGPATGRFVAESEAWILGETTTFADDDADIGGAEDKNLPIYSSHRFGVDGATWGYDIPVMEPGIYGCTAHFAELIFEAFTPGTRVFNLHFATANGDVRNFENIDVIDELDGAEFTALPKTAEDLVITGILSIRLQAVVGDAMLSGLTCERTGDLPPGVEPDFETDPQVPTAPVKDTEDDASMADGVAVAGTEVNINCGGEAIGRFSAEDFSWIRGRTSQWEGPPGVVIGGAEEKNTPAVKSHRYGVDGSDWGYVIPLENPGIYDCSLHFSETDSQSFKVGARLFDIMIMDRVLEDVDVFREADMAPFTSFVTTFSDLEITSNLMMAFKAKAGNAFVSAITCEKSGELSVSEPERTTESITESPDGEGEMTEEPSPDAVDPSLPPTVGPPRESPIPTPNTMMETPTPELGEPTPVASIASTFDDPEGSVTATVTPGAEETPSTTTGSPDDPVELDPPLSPSDGEFLQEYSIRAVVTNGEFTEVMKDALIAVSTNAVAVKSQFALTELEEEDATSQRFLKLTARQSEEVSRTYLLTVVGSHEPSPTLPADTIAGYEKFISDGTVNERIKERSIDNVEFEFIGTRAVGEGQEESSTSNTSRIVIGTLVGIFALLVVAALVAFFLSKKRRKNEPNTAAFDAPPPALTESEISSTRERSETGASVEYLDDDSTFTAATSRAGDHVDQVGFVKDVFGRGTNDGAHGSS